MGGSLPQPLVRPLQIYAFDPSLDLEIETARVNRSAIPVAWEERRARHPVRSGRRRG